MVTKLERENNTIFYLHNAWANSPDGTAGFTLEESEDAAYIGNCISMSSTEVLNPSSYNWIAVEFEAVEESDTAELTELGEDVPEDPEDEDEDYSYEDYMDGAVQSAADTATTAQESADIAQQKAEEATASAAEAKTAADTAREKAEAATTDAATAKQKAEEATSSAALAQQKAESATAAAGAAHSAAESATSDARTAGIAAATAQAAAEAAQGDINDQKKYFYHDRLGAHVLDAAGGKFRTDIKSDGVQIVQTATETTIAKYGETSTIGATDGKNVRVSGTGVEIRDGEKTLSSYGDITTIGTEDGNHIIISDDFIQAKNGDAESLKISLTPDRPTAAYSVDFDGSTVAQRVQNSETITIICQLGEDAISVDRAFLKHESTTGTSLTIDNTKNWIQYVLNTNSVTITIDGRDTEAKAVQWEKFFQLIIRYIPVRQYTSSMECDNLTAIGNLKVGNRIDASVAELESVHVGSDVFIGKYLGSERSVIEYLDESGKRANLIQVVEGTGFLELTTGKVEFHPRWWRCGNIVQMEVGTKCTGEVASGANIAVGFVTGVPKPITKSGVRSVSYYGNNANISYMGSDGTFYARNAGADALKKDNDCIGGFTYITDGTMV